MKAVWKVPLEVEDEQFIGLPSHSKILTVQVQGGKPMLWAVVDTEQPIVEFLVRTRGTEHDLNGAELGEYLGTYQLMDGQFVAHVFV